MIFFLKSQHAYDFALHVTRQFLPSVIEAVSEFLYLPGDVNFLLLRSNLGLSSTTYFDMNKAVLRFV